jgi:hypothetical protein
VNGKITPRELLKQRSILNKDIDDASSFIGLQDQVLINVMSQLELRLHNSEGLQTFLITELKYLALKNDAITFKRVLETLHGNIGSSAGKLASRLSSSKQMNQMSSMMAILVALCLHWRNTLLAASTILKYPFKDEVVESVLKSLMLKDPKYSEIQLDLILKIASKYNYKFDEYEISQLSEKLSNVHDKRTVLSKVTLFLIDHSKVDNRDQKVKKIYKLILNDSLIHNRAGMYSNWRKISNCYSEIMDHDIRILSIMIKEFSYSKNYIKLAEEIVKKIPQEQYTHAFLIEAMMEYAFKKNNIDMINLIVERLEPPVSRPVLSQLLKMNMKAGDYQGLEKIMSQISQIGLKSEDYATIVHGLLKRGDFMDALSFSQGIPPGLASSAYLKIVNYLINTRKEFQEKELVIVQNIVDKCEGVYNMKHSFWTMLSSLFIKYLTKNHGNVGVWNSKMIYERSTKDFLLKAYADSRIKSPVLDAKITLNPWSVPRDRRHLIRFQIGTRSRPIVIKTIFDRAKKLKMVEVMDWALLELTELGISPRDVKIDVTRSYNSHARNIGFRDDDKDEMFQEIWDHGSVDCVKENKALKKVPEKIIE